ncbi:MAG TPA: hypothetical protein VHA75_21005 [Rugosimonospora sp.]|nr:hypothetical protein [Rugosimonospora sp.]
MESELASRLVDYLTSRRASEDRRIEALWATLTKRERALIREIAVMADVRAAMRVSPGTAPPPPPAAAVLRDVLGACLHFEDLYPTVARLDRLAARRRTREEAA